MTTISSKPKWTEKDIPDQHGKTAIVTGANSGFGYHTARVLAEKGACVILACRDLEKAEAAARQIRARCAQADLHIQHLDLADLASVRAFAAAFAAQRSTLHLLINNAGVMYIPKRLETSDGFEMQFGANYLGHFALTGLLLGCLQRTPGARVVTLSSVVHQWGQINLQDLHARASYQPLTAYFQSKLATLMFAYELQRRLEQAKANVISVAVHPGIAVTNLQRHSWWVKFASGFVAHSPEMGALSELYAAAAPEVKGGRYYGPDGWQGYRGYPQEATSAARAHDRQVAARLWQISEELTGVCYPL